ncbi:MAG TPA: ABC transporter [Planctomycetes bacterium]|nr:ABC transporter [Planctomycetota bacterium]
MSEPALELRGVSVGAADLLRLRAGAAEEGAESGILREVDLRVERGERFALLGESGGGKSTLLKLLNRLAEPRAGEVRVLGKPVAEWAVAELRRQAVLVPSVPIRFAGPEGSVREELSAGLRWSGRPVDEAALRATLDLLGLEVALDHPAAQLSGGQQTRLNLGRALLLEPKLLLLDEPTGALDVRSARELLAALRTWAEARAATLFVVTHRPEDVRALAARSAVLLAGELHGPYTGEELWEQQEGPVAEFLGALPSEVRGT